MLELKNIVKRYGVGGDTVTALGGVSIRFRKSEFVSILGPSGCGKTTLLNIIGGLDQYTDGDLVINGRSTKNYSDRDFDTYRNHSIGFVFQSYNLIPHQSVLSNVELALTLSGVSRSERRRRASEALRRVGLEDQMKKRPSQMSGGQMQRVAIARALVNDPDILLADEPTGALDSETSVQIMDLLREVAKDKLVIMVTHNPELAAEYSTRIIRVLDGRVIADSDPYDGEAQDTSAADIDVKDRKDKKEKKTKKTKKASGKGSPDRKTSMSFLTALSLSFNNLMTKKTRTFMTSFAGSIGIIGIALILSVSTGVNAYISQVQEDTLTSYPLTINAESDMMSMLGTFMGKQAEELSRENEDGYVYSRNVMFDMMSSMMSNEGNNLTPFKEFLETSEDVKKYASSVRYGYNANPTVYTKDPTGKIISCDMQELMTSVYADMGVNSGSASDFGSAFSSMASFNVWQEMLPGENGELISPAITEQYETVWGEWPKSYDEAVMVVSENNELSDFVLYSLGLKPYDEMIGIMQSATMGKEPEMNEEDFERWSFEDMLGREYRLVLPVNKYQHQADGTYVDLTETETGLKYIYGNDELSAPVKIVGIIRAVEDASAANLTGAIAYTSALTDHLIESADNADLVKTQLADTEKDVLSGLPFKPADPVELTDAEKAERIKGYFTSLAEADLAQIYLEIMCTPTDEYVNGMIDQMIGGATREESQQMMIDRYAAQMGVTDTSSIEAYLSAMSDAEFEEFFRSNAAEAIKEQYAAAIGQQLSAMTDAALIAAFGAAEHTEAEYAAYYERYMPDEYSSSSFEENLKKLGYVDRDVPSSISIYVSTFNDKDEITNIINRYNNGASEEDQIKYTDYFALMISSVSTVINAISYVLIAFVAISLVVSSIMIGIITYISVLERTKEIGILRAIGASKKDIARVFNAETVTVGFASGVIGIGVTLLLIIPINLIIHHVTGIPTLSAQLPPMAGVILVLISMALTVIAGLFPSGYAAKKDPVVALRTE